MYLKVLCDQCSEEIPSKDYSNHVERTHDTSSHICPDCGKEIIGIGAFRNHQMFHKRAKRWTCDQCDKEMAEHSKNRHQRNCKGKKAEPKIQIFSCPEEGCSYMSHLKAKIERHRKSMHVQVICEDCGYQFGRQALLNAHRKKMHDAKAKAPRRHKCGYCVYQATKLSHLKRHEENHCGGKKRTAPPEQGPMTKRARLDAFIQSGCSISGHKKAEKVYKSWFGSHWFEEGSTLSTLRTSSMSGTRCTNTEL